MSADDPRQFTNEELMLERLDAILKRLDAIEKRLDVMEKMLAAGRPGGVAFSPEGSRV